MLRYSECSLCIANKRKGPSPGVLAVDGKIKPQVMDSKTSLGVNRMQTQRGRVAYYWSFQRKPLLMYSP